MCVCGGGGCAIGGGIGFGAEGRFEKNRKREGVPVPSMPPTTMGNFVCSY